MEYNEEQDEYGDEEEENDFEAIEIVNKVDFCCSFQLIVIISDNISKTSEAVLKRLPNLILKKVKGIPNPYEESKYDLDVDDDKPSWTGSGYTKLHIWSLV